MIAYRVQYVGEVQGVYFRATAKEIADEYGLAGWVRNLSDGSVELFVQGWGEVVVAFLADLAARYEGKIRDETRTEEAADPELRSFEVR